MKKIDMNINSKFFLAVLATAMLGACTDEAQQASEPKQKPAEVKQAAPVSVEPAQGPSEVFVHLFEWRWPDIAAECEEFLGPNGYAAVQVSPPQEHVIGPQWWVRYQPVSYRVESRGGTRTESRIIRTCGRSGTGTWEAWRTLIPAKRLCRSKLPAILTIC